MLKSIYQVFFFVHRFSLDIALGAVAMLYALSFPSAVDQNRLAFYFLLFFGTLLIYWIDHLQDSQEPLLVQPGARHSVFKTHKGLLIVLCTLLSIANSVVAIWFLKPLELLYGFCLLVALGAYLTLHRNLKRIFILEKEILIASLYCVSILFAPIAQFKNSFFSYSFVSLLLAGVLVFLTTLQNLFSIARIESDLDRRNTIRNITHTFGSKRLERLQIAMVLLQICIGLVFLIMCSEPNKYRIVCLFTCISLIEFSLPHIFMEPKNSTYRFIGELAFLLGFLAH